MTGHGGGQKAEKKERLARPPRERTQVVRAGTPKKQPSVTTDTH